MVTAGEIKRKACPRCGGDLKKEEDPEYNVAEWVCINLCGCRLTPDQIKKFEEEKAAAVPDLGSGQVQDTAGKKFSQENKQEEESMIENGVKIEDLDDETLVKVGNPIPPKPDLTGLSKYPRNIKLHEYYEANKDAIIVDFRMLGLRPMLRKWEMSESGWRTIGKRWLPEEVSLRSEREKAAAPAAGKSSSDRSKLADEKQVEKTAKDLIARFKKTSKAVGIVPQLPPWNESWGDSVKIAWLEAWSNAKRP